MGSDFESEWPRSPTPEWLSYRYRELAGKVSLLEQAREKYDPAVTNERLTNLGKDMTNLAKDVVIVKRALYGLMFVIVASSVTFAFTVFALLGKGHP